MEEKDIFNNDKDLNNDEDESQDTEEDIYLDLSNIKLA